METAQVRQELLRRDLKRQIHRLVIQNLEEELVVALKADDKDRIIVLEKLLHEQKVYALKDQLTAELADCKCSLARIRSQLLDVQETAGEGDVENRGSQSAEGDSLRGSYATLKIRQDSIQSKLDQLENHPELAFTCIICGADISERVNKARPDSERCTKCKSNGNGNGRKRNGK
ncbi:hypothetical protein COX05_02875 [candidate division WWE3 bacterium CG22_combo_CG10-13_8_21_14_all_39_12]|uniref:DksA C4-type domain-containing protein n=1 Tax=candidate division WWE3 bacterium CG22_combo_CG10-13_8_21_14_all_39_12 TaxID=1975094 RepID=A0A2H0BFL3_UNCKA|nr:MAG: hypothetical protein COX05_02875 [candidate division WWE3 bacterium CG22_combo_CG10-13_8_21_14_all_39_12]